MAYSELIKNFGRIRDYMREFYVYGFKSRGEYTGKSARSYDDEKRRMESLLGDYMRFRRTPDGKNVFISVNSRSVRHNPLYQAWKAKSFTDGDITLHFLLMDILPDTGEGLNVPEITDRLGERGTESAHPFDESTVRKKLKEYVEEGIVTAEKNGKNVLYRRNPLTDLSDCSDALDFFSEVAPCGVVGSFLLDKGGVHDERFAFKHHYITSSLDSEILCSLFDAMAAHRSVSMEVAVPRSERALSYIAVPLRVMSSVQSGRQYLMAYVPHTRRITSFRIDRITEVNPGEVCDRFDALRTELNEMQAHLWGISTQSRSGERLEHVDFTIRYAEDEKYIPQRLEREKRCGTVEHFDNNTSRFSADVYDVSEMVPWIRTFLCRITALHISDEKTEKQFLDDIRAMYAMYGIEKGGEDDAVQ